MNRIELIRTHLKANQTKAVDNNDLLAHVTLAPADPILGTTIKWRADTAPEKLNLGVGAYRTDQEKPYVFEIVKQAEKELLEDLLTGKINKEYLGTDGHAGFREASKKLVFGQDCTELKRIVTVQSISGTGALRVAGEFIRKHIPGTIHVPNPTWITHHAIFNNAGLQFKQYPYYNPKNRGFDFDGMLGYLNTLPKKSIVLLHAAAHNPTGVDPSKDQWKKIAETMKAKDLVPFFDTAYQGFASGDIENDAFAIRHFLANGFQMFVSQSYAKNMGMYGERIGALHVVCANENTAKNVNSQLLLVMRPMYSNPPMHGALVVHKILTNPDYLAKWKAELKNISHRVLDMRKLLRDEIERIGTPGNWEHITNQIGMFTYTGMSEKACIMLIEKLHVYMLKNGRISMTGVNTKNVKYLAASMKKAIETA